MAQADRIPFLRGEERVFFDHARDHELVFQTCDDCDARIWYLRTLCPQCLGSRLRLTQSSGRGTIYSFTTLYRAGHESRRPDVPYTVVLVDLAEGVRMPGDLRGVAVADIRIGMPVTVEFIDLSESMTVPGFTAAPAEE